MKKTRKKYTRTKPKINWFQMTEKERWEYRFNVMYQRERKKYEKMLLSRNIYNDISNITNIAEFKQSVQTIDNDLATQVALGKRKTKGDPVKELVRAEVYGNKWNMTENFLQGGLVKGISPEDYSHMSLKDRMDLKIRIASLPTEEFYRKGNDSLINWDAMAEVYSMYKSMGLSNAQAGAKIHEQYFPDSP